MTTTPSTRVITVSCDFSQTPSAAEQRAVGDEDEREAGDEQRDAEQQATADGTSARPRRSGSR